MRSESPSVAGARAAEAVGQLDPGLRQVGRHRHPLFGEALARVGRTVGGRWRLERLIGLGGMAAVYAATHRNGHRVAIKMLHPRHEEKPDVRERFRREGIVGNRVRHPGAVKVLDDHVGDAGQAFLVMELLEGESLEQLLGREGQLPVPAALAVIDALLDVLVAAHEAGVLHRDLKPGNIFLTRAGEVKLLDFGVARLVALSERRGGTKVGTVLGTPAFMAPEQARGDWDAVDERTDVWALGANLFAMVTGAAVHEAPSDAETLVAAATRPAMPVSLLRPSLTPELAACIDRSLAFVPSDRFPDARSLRRALREAAGELGPGAFDVAAFVRPGGAVAADDGAHDWDTAGGEATVRDSARPPAPGDGAAGRRRARTSIFSDDFAQTSLFGDSMVRAAARRASWSRPGRRPGTRKRIASSCASKSRSRRRR